MTAPFIPVSAISSQYVTLNSQDTLDLPVKTNERLRVRIINAANAPIFQFRIARHPARVMAVDGQPRPPIVVANAPLRLAPGNRVDLFLDATLEPGMRAPILVDDEVGRLVYEAGARFRPSPLPEPAPLPDNPLPARMDFSGALRLDVPLDGGGMAMMMGRGGMMGGGSGGTGFRGYGLARSNESGRSRASHPRVTMVRRSLRSRAGGPWC